MSRPDSPLRSNLADDDTCRKLKAMVIKEKRINKENSKIIADLTSNIEVKTKETDQLINQIQRLSNNMGLLEENETANLEAIQSHKNEIQCLNKKLEELQLIVSEKDEKLMKTNKHLNLIYEKLQLSISIHNDNQFEDIIMTLEKYLKIQSEKLEENTKHLNQLYEKKIETLKKEFDNFKNDICQNFNDIFSTKSSLLPKALLNGDDELNKISGDIITSLKSLVLTLNNKIETNNVLQDGLDKVVYKCNDLESTIESQNEKLTSFNNLPERLQELQIDLEQRDEQIKRLEELIEDNRNISRALETERDQLQNDLVDLRQRHEEKEGYLMEEYREAKQNLESYRIFNDKESAYKIGEIEKLRKLLSQYQQEMNADEFMNDCRLCREFELLAKALKERFEIADDSFCHEDIIGKIVAKFETLQNLFLKQIDGFQKNENGYRNDIEVIEQRIRAIEETMKNSKESLKTNGHDREIIDSLKICIEEKDKIIEETNGKVSDLEESRLILVKENENLNEIIKEINLFFNLNSTSSGSSIIEQIKQVLIEEKSRISREIDEKIEDKKLIDFLKAENEERTNIIEETNSKMSELEESRWKLEKENENLSEIINEINILFGHDNTGNKSSIIEHLKQYSNEEKSKIDSEIKQKIEELEKSNLHEKIIIDSLKEDIEEKKKIIEETNSKVSKLEESQTILLKENENFSEIIKEINILFKLNRTSTRSSIIEQIKQVLSEEKSRISREIDEKIEDKKLIDFLKAENEERTKIIEETNSKMSELEESRWKLEKENENLSEIINEINILFGHDNTGNKSSIIEHLKQYSNEDKSNTDNDIGNKIKQLQQSSLNDKRLIDSLNEDIKERNTIINNNNCNISELEESLSKLLKENGELNEIIHEINDLFKFDNTSVNSSIINNLNQFINGEKEEIEQLQQANLIDKRLIDSLTEDIQERKKIIGETNNEMLELRESLSSLLNEKEYFTQLIEELNILFKFDNTNPKLSTIEQLKQSVNYSENLCRQITEYKSELEIQKDKFHNLFIENESLIEKLSKLEKHSSGNDLMNLEMAEFDKTLINLNNQLLVKTSQVEDLEAGFKSKETLLQTFREQLIDKEKQNTFLEERSHKMKQLLVKTKRELADCKGELEQVKLTNSNNRDQVESLIIQLEENKILLSETLNEKEKSIDHHATAFKKLETISKNKDVRLAELRSQLESSLNTNQSLQQEFESYKIKAQNALYTQRPKSTFSNFMTTESAESKQSDDVDKKDLKKQIVNLDVIIKDLKLEVQEADDKMFSLTHELDSLRWDKDKLIDKNKVLSNENNELNIKLQQIVQESQEIDKIQKNSYSSLIERFDLEKENIVSKYLNQIEKSKFNYETEISNLEQRLADIEIEKIKYQEEIWSCREQLRNAEQKLSGINFSTDNQISVIKYQSWSNNFKNPLEHERQQGEGMETTSELDDLDSVNNQHLSPQIAMTTRSYNNTLVPLDKLINSVDDDSTRLLEEQLAFITTQSQASKKKITHLNELLNDSEATVARLTEQATILKSEIRRLEKNNDRDSKLTDEPTHEYLKNVIMKFLDCETKLDERGHLVPVLVTLLSLDLNEKEKLITFSKLIQFDRRQNVDGWSSYFNWTGIQ